MCRVISALCFLFFTRRSHVLARFLQQFWQPAGPTADNDVKPFTDMKSFNGQQPGSQTNANTVALNNNNTPAWEGRSIASHKLRLTEFTAFMEAPPGPHQQPPLEKHIFVQIGGPQATYTDPLLEDIDIRQISDKFPGNKGGLKELYDKGPPNAFFLVKFWVSARNQWHCATPN